MNIEDIGKELAKNVKNQKDLSKITVTKTPRRYFIITMLKL